MKVNTGVPQLDAAMQTVITIALGVICILGIYKTLIGVKTWSDANEEMDAARRSQGLNTIISGVVMIAAPAILGILGVAV